MKATVNTIRVSQNQRKTGIYINNSPLNEVADKFATENGIYFARFKSKVWSKIKRMVNTAHTPLIKSCIPDALKEKFVDDVGEFTISYSDNAGCSCGCSPGYVLRRNSNVCYNIWVTVEATEKEVSEFTQKVNALLPEWEKEVESHKLTTV